MARFAIDTEERKTGSRAYAIIHYKIDYDHWFIEKLQKLMQAEIV